MKYLSNSSSLACKSFAIFKGHSWEEGKRWVFDNSINKISSDDLFLGGETGMLDLDGISIDVRLKILEEIISFKRKLTSTLHH